MRLLVRLLSLAFIAAALQLACADEIPPSSGLNGLPEIALPQLSEQDRSALGLKALAIHPQDWKHGETEHFIYHFQRSFVVTPVSVEAEFHFRVVTKELGKSETPSASPKAHIYIFEQAADWELFQSVGGLEPWTGGIQSGSSLFIVRNPAYKFTDNSLGHEIAHLVLQRFFGAHIPVWLNEGFAQYVSKGAHASFRRARGWIVRPSSSGIQEEKLFPIPRLTTMSYPPADQVETFYDESERLIRFLAAANRPAFSEFIELSAKGERFDDALARAYGTSFDSTGDFENRFMAYAAKDAPAMAHQ